jgi:regulator of protease activity HflC (stomatin/prohibitin superfamily)
MNTSLSFLRSVGIGLAAIVLVAVVATILFILTSAIKIVKEYERGVIFRLGRVQGRAKGPGLFILIPIVDRMVKVGLASANVGPRS